MIAEIAGKRAALFGRAPVIGDIDVAIALLGYDGSADDAFVELRGRGSCTSRRTTTRAGARSSTRSPRRCCGCEPASWPTRVVEWRRRTVAAPSCVAADDARS